jgi:nitroreductase
MDNFTQTLIHTRHHVSPKRLGDPGPNREQINEILAAAGAAPDHGRVTPWHFYEITQQSRGKLGEVFAQCLLDRDKEASETQIADARDKALRGPLLLLAVAKLGSMDEEIPAQEKLISAGCAIQNILLTVHDMGFAAGISSGKAIYSKRMKDLFSLGEDEAPLCFITIGTPTSNKAGRIRPNFSDYSTQF